jgi:hypothetical protein
MSGPKPTAGYASRTDAVMALAARGLGRREIAERLHIEPDSVSVFYAYGRARLERRRTRPVRGAAAAGKPSAPPRLLPGGAARWSARWYEQQEEAFRAAMRRAYGAAAKPPEARGP